MESKAMAPKAYNSPDAWFTFMLYSYVDPTNGWAEQQAHEAVRQGVMGQTI